MQRIVLILSLLVVGLSCVVAFWGLSWPLQGSEQVIFWQLRLPVIVTALIVGAGLALSSAVLQVLLHNPLADPGIIGITSGASLSAAVFLLFGGASLIGFSPYLLPVACFTGALLSALLIYLLAKKFGNQNHTLILAGLGISAICAAIIAWLYLFADAQSMRNLTFWLMGSLHQADWPILMVAAPITLLALSFLLRQGQALNRYYFGVDAAQLSGVKVAQFRQQCLLLSALLVAIAVATAGSIAFVGLLVPHMLRNFIGFDNRIILPASALGGALLMLLVVLISQFVSGVLLPVSMLTASLGAPVFIYSMVKATSRA